MGRRCRCRCCCVGCCGHTQLVLPGESRGTTFSDSSCAILPSAASSWWAAAALRAVAFVVMAANFFGYYSAAYDDRLYINGTQRSFKEIEPLPGRNDTITSQQRFGWHFIYLTYCSGFIEALYFTTVFALDVALYISKRRRDAANRVTDSSSSPSAAASAAVEGGRPPPSAEAEAQAEAQAEAPVVQLPLAFARSCVGVPVCVTPRLTKNRVERIASWHIHRFFSLMFAMASLVTLAFWLLVFPGSSGHTTSYLITTNIDHTLNAIFAWAELFLSFHLYSSIFADVNVVLSIGLLYLLWNFLAYGINLAWVYDFQKNIFNGVGAVIYSILLLLLIAFYFVARCVSVGAQQRHARSQISPTAQRAKPSSTEVEMATRAKPAAAPAASAVAGSMTA